MMRIRLLLSGAVILGCLAGGPVWSGEKWPGIDEAVVNRIAREQGREARKSWIDTGEGDLQLFVFLLAGAAGGFVAGYYWRMLLEGRKDRSGDRPVS